MLDGGLWVCYTVGIRVGKTMLFENLNRKGNDMKHHYITQEIVNAVKQMEHEVFELLSGNDFDERLERIEDCAREIIGLKEKL